MANARELAGKMKRIKIGDYSVDIPKGLSKDEEAKHIADLTERIENDEDLRARRESALEARRKFDERYAQVLARNEREQFERLKAKFELNGGANPAE